MKKKCILKYIFSPMDVTHSTGVYYILIPDTSGIVLQRGDILHIPKNSIKQFKLNGLQVMTDLLNSLFQGENQIRTVMFLVWYMIYIIQLKIIGIIIFKEILL